MEKKKLYVAYGRCGTLMKAPVFFQTEKEAKKYIQHEIADCIRNYFHGEMEEDEELFDMKRYDEDDHVFSWASLKGYCKCYNISGIYDTACTGEDEWTEYDLTEVNLPDDLEDNKVSVDYRQSKTIVAFLKKFDEWTKKVSDEPFETDCHMKSQTFSCGYEVEYIKPCDFGYRIDVFLKERAIKENDCIRMGDIVSFIYVGKEDTIYLNEYAEGSQNWYLGFME